MIYCPKCGTANRDQSRFCNECGQELGNQTRVKCPQCGTMNPVQNVFCSECRGRLLPSLTSPSEDEAPVTGKEPSLHAEQDEETAAPSTPESEDDTPAWLRELGATLSEEDRSDAQGSLENGAEFPDWLRDLRGLSDESESDMEHAQAEKEDKEDADSYAPDKTAARHLETPLPSAETEGSLDARDEAQPTHPSEAQSGPTPSGDEQVPDWLAELRSSAVEVEHTSEPFRFESDDTEPELTHPSLEIGEEEMPDWLADLRSLGGSTEEPAMPAFEAADDRVPDDWIEAEASVTETGVESTSSISEARDEEMPDWLAELRSATAESEAEPSPPSFAASEEEPLDVPIEPGSAAEPDEPELPAPTFEIEEGELPDWLAGLRPTAAAEFDATPVAPDSEEEQAYDQSLEFQLQAGGTEADFTLPDSDTGEERDADWQVEAEPGSMEEEPSVILPPGDEIPVTPATLDWLAELRSDVPDEGPQPLEEPPAEAEQPEWLVPAEPQPDGEESLVRAEIPAWLLALKPRELRQEGEEEGPTPAVEEPFEETGILAGLQGTLPVEMIIAQPRAVASAARREYDVVETPQARLFADIVSRPPEAAPKKVLSTPTHVLAPMSRWIIYIALIAVVTLPILWGKPLLPRTIEPATATTDLYNAVESLDSAAVVLVAFDYDPASSGEMDALAQTLIGHLMDRGASIVVVSLLPAGPATAQLLLEELAGQRPDYDDSYGRSYVNLGYLPGQATAVRLLGISLETALPRDFRGTPLAELPIMENLSDGQDFDLIIELAAGQDTLQWWIEQTSTPYGIPMGAAVSALVEPLARPYYETASRQLVGMVGGVPGAITYQALRDPELEDATAAGLDSQLAGHIFLVLVLLVGNGIYLLRRGTGRER